MWDGAGLYYCQQIFACPSSKRFVKALGIGFSQFILAVVLHSAALFIRLRNILRKCSGVDGAAAPRLEKFRAHSDLQGKRSVAQKSWMQKVYSIQWEIQAKCMLFKILNDKKYIFNTMNSGHTLFFRASASCSKILKDKKYLNAGKIFRANTVFQGNLKLFKILNDNNCIFNTISGYTMFFRESAKLLKIPVNGKKIYSMQWRIPGQTPFSEQAQVAQKSWKIKNISIQ